METFIITIMAKSGHEAQVTRFYESLREKSKNAKGLIDRKMFRARTGLMAEEVKKIYTAEQLAAHPEPPHADAGTQFVIVEIWESIEDRMLNSKNSETESRIKDLVPHLLPDHSHEFYEEI